MGIPLPKTGEGCQHRLSKDRLMQHYWSVIAMFMRNSLIRELGLRGHFWVMAFTRGIWFVSQLFLFQIIFGQVQDINSWSREEFYAFLATGMLINTLSETLFLPNCAKFSEAIRSGNLDFVLLKPIDTQFLVSFERIDLSNTSQIGFALALLSYALWHLGRPIGITEISMYLLLIVTSVSFLYSLMIMLASTSIWFGRNTGLYDFWFYLTIFARYPRDIYRGGVIWGGEALLQFFSFVVPILLVATVPSQLLIQKLLQPSWLAFSFVLTTAVSLMLARLVFNTSLRSYRSAGG